MDQPWGHGYFQKHAVCVRGGILSSFFFFFFLSFFQKVIGRESMGKKSRTCSSGHAAAVLHVLYVITACMLYVRVILRESVNPQLSWGRTEEVPVVGLGLGGVSK